MSVMPVDQRGYTNPQLLAETDWLAEHMDDLQSASSMRGHPNNMPAGHIPGAVTCPASAEFPGPPTATWRVLKNSLELRAARHRQWRHYQSSTMRQATRWEWSHGRFSTTVIRTCDCSTAAITSGHRRGDQSLSGRKVTPQTIFRAEPVEAIYCSLRQANPSHGRHQTVFGYAFPS